jgi:hypothetical protein
MIELKLDAVEVQALVELLGDQHDAVLEGIFGRIVEAEAVALGPVD